MKSSYLVIAIVIISFIVYRRFSLARKRDLSPDQDYLVKIENDMKAEKTLEGNSDHKSTKESGGEPEFTYEIVGESFQRDHLVELIRSDPNAGELFADAILELEPTNAFDPTAVKVIVKGIQVGYIPKFDSEQVSKMITKSKKKNLIVKARIGWDTDSPSPLIGVRLALNLD